jgi:hypothetical protein
MRLDPYAQAGAACCSATFSSAIDEITSNPAKLASAGSA